MTHGRSPRIALVAALLAVAAVLAPVRAPVARAASGDLVLATASTYTLAPASRAVRVVVDVTARNDKPDLVFGGVRTRYFYDGFRIGIQPEATAIRATSAGSTLATTTNSGDGFLELDVRFPASLFHGQTRKVRLAFDLPAGAPRSSSEIRVGPAFGTFTAWAFGDSGSVRIVVPAAFDAETTGNDVVRTRTPANATVFTAASVTDVPSWYVVVTADRPSALTHDHLDLPGGEHLVIHAWPDDPAWDKDVSALLRTGLPELVGSIGLDWPVTGDLDVFEVHTPLLEGYAGVFLEGENRIEISEDLDDLTIVHEASHAWFNGDLFDGRWINEGLADTYAARTLDAIGLGGWTPGSVTPGDPAAVKLNDWAFPGRITDDETDAREQFGYDAAWTVMRSIVAEVGEERMRDVLAAAQHRTIPYVGAGTAEPVDGPADWRRLLDLLDEVGRSTTADDLFRSWVVAPGDLATLADRTTTRADYAALLTAGGDWLPPIYVRRPMADWSFSAARDRIDEANAVLGKRDRLATIAAMLGVPAPPDARSAYQTATTSLDDANAVLDREIDAGQAVEAAAAAVAAPRDGIVSVGLMGETPETRLAAVRGAFGRGDPTTVADAAALSALMAGADGIGRARILTVGAITVVLLLVLVLMVALLVWRSRRNRSPAGTVVAPSWPLPSGSTGLASPAALGKARVPAYATLADQSAAPGEPVPTTGLEPDATSGGSGDAT